MKIGEMYPCESIMTDKLPKSRIRTLRQSVYIFTLSLLLLAGCARLPDNSNRTFSTALQGNWPPDSGPLDHPEKTGVYLLSNGLDAFVARAALIKAAKVGLDVQYYLFHNDFTGNILVYLLSKAADRGVRIRLLLDDMGLSGRDEGIAILDSHPNIEVRIFNPFSRKAFRGTQMVARFGSVTRRMHNKSLTADNLLSIVGGRNIGDEYFSANPLVEFGDLDVLAAGQVVSQVSESFDEYWNSDFSFPITTLSGNSENKSFKELHDYLEKIFIDAGKSEYADALRKTDLVKQLADSTLQFEWVDAQFFSDPPSKINESTNTKPITLLSDVGKLMNQTREELLIFSPYFVPGKNGVAFFKSLVEKGVKVKILTNSLASNDVAIVHSGYAKYRKPLLRAGVELYELNSIVPKNKRKVRGASKASLHAKSFIMDREKIFVGSLNLDPRSISENTEIGVVFSSPLYGKHIGDSFNKVVGMQAFRLKLIQDQIRWTINQDGKEIEYTTEPNTGFWKRFGVWCMSLLPVESQL
jgi:putative cardiolipin synthase